MRGLTFVHEESGPVRYLALRKFFNINQTIGSMYSDVANKTIRSITAKEDGSMISFIKVNGKLIPKTKQSFDNEQIDLVNSYLEKNPELAEKISCEIDAGIMNIYELVSPLNKIVLDYDHTELILLQTRSNDTGLYYGTPPERNLMSKFHTIRQIEEFLEDSEGIEGFVVTFDDGLQIKMKSHWYFTMHKLVTENLTHENYIIEAVLREIIDDGISMLVPTNPLRIYVEELATRLSAYFSHQVKMVAEALKDFNGDRKEFALQYKDTSVFPILMRCISNQSEENIEECVKKHIIKKTAKLGNAREFVEKTLNLTRSS